MNYSQKLSLLLNLIEQRNWLKTNNHSIIYRNDFYGLILLFFNDNCIDYALIQKSKILDFKFPTPDQNNQITQNDKKLFDISNKFFEICELLDEYEVIPIDQITSKILILDFNYKKKQFVPLLL